MTTMPIGWNLYSPWRTIIHIKKRFEATAAVLPDADGYLAQIDFKNGWRDFRWKDCVFAKTLDDIVRLTLESEDTLSEGGYLELEDGDTVDGVIAALQKEGYPAKASTLYPGQVYVPVAYSIKIWPMVAGQRVQKGITAYVLIKEKRIGNKKDVDVAMDAVPAP